MIIRRTLQHIELLPALADSVLLWIFLAGIRLHDLSMWDILR